MGELGLRLPHDFQGDYLLESQDSKDEGLPPALMLASLPHSKHPAAGLHHYQSPGGKPLFTLWFIFWGP